MPKKGYKQSSNQIEKAWNNRSLIHGERMLFDIEKYFRYCEICGELTKNKRFCSRKCKHSALISNETRARMKEAGSRKILSAEHRKKIGIAGKGRTPWNKGLTKETNEIIFQSAMKNTGKVLSPSHKAKLSKALIGRPPTERQREVFRQYNLLYKSEEMKKAYANGTRVVSTNHPRYEKAKRWCNYDKKWVTFRSSYERIYAEWLDKNNISWQYEPKVFKLGNTSYRPDFYLPETDNWVETKGIVTNESVNKSYLMGYYHGIHVSILGPRHIKNLKQLIS